LIIGLVGMIEKGKIHPDGPIWVLHLVYLAIGVGLLTVPEWLRRRKVKQL